MYLKIIILSTSHGQTFKEFKHKIKIAEKVDQNIVLEGKSALAKILNTKKQNETFVISDEGLCGNQQLGYKNSNYIAEILKRISQNTNIKVFIIIYLRRQDEFFESFYFSYTRHLLAEDLYDFNKFYDKYGQNDYNWYKLVNNYATTFGKDNVIVRLFDNIYLPNFDSIYNDFAEIIGVNKQYKDKLTIPPPSKTNKGYSMDAEYVDLICKKVLNVENKLLLKKILQLSNPKNVFEKYSYFTKDQREEFLLKHQESNKKLLNEFFHENTKLFSDIDHSTYNEYGEFDINKLTRVIMNIEIYNYKKLNNLEVKRKFYSKIKNFIKRFIN